MIYKNAHSKDATVEYKLWYDHVKNREVIHDGTFIYKFWTGKKTGILPRKLPESEK